MCLSGEVKHNLRLRDQGVDQLTVSDISIPEGEATVPVLVIDLWKILRIARVG
jgi:hypothetical protein